MRSFAPSVLLVVGFWFAAALTQAQSPSRPRVYTLEDKPESSRRNVYEALLQKNQGDRGTNTHVQIVEPLGEGAYIVASETLREPVKLILLPSRPAFRAGASIAVTLKRAAGSHEYTSPDGEKKSLQIWREVTAAETAQAGWKSYGDFLATLRAGGREWLERPRTAPCADCKGTGLVIRGVNCRRCAGRGTVPIIQKFLVIWSREAATRSR